MGTPVWLPAGCCAASEETPGRVLLFIVRLTAPSCVQKASGELNLGTGSSPVPDRDSKSKESTMTVLVSTTSQETRGMRAAHMAVGPQPYPLRREP